MHLSRTEISYLVDEHVHNIRHRPIVIDRLCDGLTFEELAERHHFSVRHVKRIYYSAMEDLIPFLTE